VDDVSDLLRRLRSTEPTRPRLTWYGPDDERVELSGKVLDNWVAKTANLLVEEHDTGPGTRVHVALPVHWRAVVWALATWATGAVVVLNPKPDATDVDVVVAEAGTPAASGGSGSATPIAVALPALAASDVRLYGDVFAPIQPRRPGDAALEIGGVLRSTHAELLPAARARAAADGIRAGERRLVDEHEPDPLAGWLPVLAVDGSFVLHCAWSRLDDDRRAAVAAAERLTLS
jgi:uncharacterized protein (TIGR03089 family)